MHGSSSHSRSYPSWLFVLGVSVGAAVTAACEPADMVPEEEPLPGTALVFQDVTIVETGQEAVTPWQTVVVREGRIDRVGPVDEVEVPEDALLIDGEGRYLMPGMAEMHGHLPGADPTSPEVQDLLFLYVSQGVTTVRGMQGHPAQLEIRRAIEDGDLLGPRLILGSPAMGWGNLPDAQEAPERVREFSEVGFDLIKIGEGADPATYDALVQTAREEGLPVAGHVPDDVGLMEALAAGQVTIDHLDNYVEELVPEEERQAIAPLWGVASVGHLADEGRIPELVDATVESGAAQVPTMVLWEIFFGDRTGEELREAHPEVRYMPPDVVDGWESSLANLHETIGHPEGVARVVELRRAIFRHLHEAGATFLLGTDSPQLFSVPGFSNHREMQLWVELGMTPFEVVRAGTWNVADHLGELDESGSVEEGRRADLILLEANPLDDIGNVARRAGVVMQGRWIPEEEIQERLASMAERHREAGR